MYLLGISAFYHDSAACLIKDGNILAAAQEERFTRNKHDADFPSQAIQYCLQEAGISLQELEAVVFHEKPFLKFERLLETYLHTAPSGFRSFQKAMPIWIKEKLFQKKIIRNNLDRISQEGSFKQKLLFSEHHLSHAASAFYPSPFKEALVLTMDGVGEWATTSVAHGRDNQLEIVQEQHFPDSLGLLYSAFTYYTGFKVNSGEYKLMGLAPYGDPKYAQRIFDHLVDLKEDGSFRLNQAYFNYRTGLTMTNEAFNSLMGNPNRKSEGTLSQFHMDIAASIQKVTEEIIFKITDHLAKTYEVPYLCMAGGVALNCVANGKLLRRGKYKGIWIQPAAGDAGCALGAAQAAYHQHYRMPRDYDAMGQDSMKGSYLGPSYKKTKIESDFIQVKARYHELKREELIQNVAEALASGAAVGWMQGRMEFGPRALGARSIIADPRSPHMQKQLNLKIKFRESFRPFAPAILEEDASEWFDLKNGEKSPYMLIVADVLKKHRHELTETERALFGIEQLNLTRSAIPAVTHVDYSARVQTVSARTNPRFYELLQAFKARTGCPILVNTSFNVRGEPIVCTPEDAYKCFMGTGLDMLVVEDFILRKSEQDSSMLLDYKAEFALD